MGIFVPPLWVFVSIPLGGFFVGKVSPCNSRTYLANPSQSPSGDFLLGRKAEIKGNNLVITMSQSPSGDFLLGRTSLSRCNTQSWSQSPSGDFLLGRRITMSRSFFSIGSQSPSGDFLLGSMQEQGLGEEGRESLNPPRGIFCWEDGHPCSRFFSRTSCLNPPRGIFCWEGQR